jgi:hypothetical protein
MFFKDGWLEGEERIPTTTSNFGGNAYVEDRGMEPTSRE